MGRLKLLALAFGSWMFAPALTAQTFPDWFLIPCEDSPPGAIVEIPEPLNQIASVQCTVFGHVITGSSEYNWSVLAFDGGSASYFVPAQEYVDGQLTEGAHDNFFTDITGEKLEGQRLDNVYLRITGEQPSGLEILSGSLLKARNQQNFEIEIFVVTAKFYMPTDGELIQSTLGYEVRSDLSRPRRDEGYRVFGVNEGVYAYNDTLSGVFPIEAVQPDYPEGAVLEGITEGYCTIRFTITTTGTTKDHEVEDCSNAIFEEASIRAAESLRYRPRISYWRAREAKTHYRFTFELGPENP